MHLYEPGGWRPAATMPRCRGRVALLDIGTRRVECGYLVEKSCVKLGPNSQEPADALARPAGHALDGGRRRQRAKRLLQTL